MKFKDPQSHEDVLYFPFATSIGGHPYIFYGKQCGMSLPELPETLDFDFYVALHHDLCSMSDLVKLKNFWNNRIRKIWDEMQPYGVILNQRLQETHGKKIGKLKFPRPSISKVIQAREAKHSCYFMECLLIASSTFFDESILNLEVVDNKSFAFLQQRFAQIRMKFKIGRTRYDFIDLNFVPNNWLLSKLRIGAPDLTLADIPRVNIAPIPFLSLLFNYSTNSQSFREIPDEKHKKVKKTKSNIKSSRWTREVLCPFQFLICFHADKANIIIISVYSN